MPWWWKGRDVEKRMMGNTVCGVVNEYKDMGQCDGQKARCVAGDTGKWIGCSRKHAWLNLESRKAGQ